MTQEIATVAEGATVAVVVGEDKADGSRPTEIGAPRIIWPLRGRPRSLPDALDRRGPLRCARRGHVAAFAYRAAAQGRAADPRQGRLQTCRSFTPNGDCRRDRGRIRFRMTRSDRAKIEIVDLDDRPCAASAGCSRSSTRAPAALGGSRTAGRCSATASSSFSGTAAPTAASGPAGPLQAAGHPARAGPRAGPAGPLPPPRGSQPPAPAAAPRKRRRSERRRCCPRRRCSPPPRLAAFAILTPPRRGRSAAMLVAPRSARC